MECDDLINKNTKSQKKKIHKCIALRHKNIEKKNYIYTQQHTSARELTMRSDFFIKKKQQQNKHIDPTQNLYNITYTNILL